jgi:hypothetical protein
MTAHIAGLNCHGAMAPMTVAGTQVWEKSQLLTDIFSHCRIVDAVEDNELPLDWSWLRNSPSQAHDATQDPWPAGIGSSAQNGE